MDADLPGAAAAAAAAPAGPAPAAPPSPAPAEEEEEDVVAGAEKEIAGGDDKMKRKRRRSAVEWWNDLVQATRYEETAADGVVTIRHTLDVSDAAFGEFNANKTGGGDNYLYLSKKNLGR